MFLLNHNYFIKFYHYYTCFIIVLPIISMLKIKISLWVKNCRNLSRRGDYRPPTFFHTSYPQLCAYLRNSKKWKQASAKLHGDNKARCLKSKKKSSEKSNKKSVKGGYGGHFRAIQGFKYLENEEI